MRRLIVLCALCAAVSLPEPNVQAQFVQEYQLGQRPPIVIESVQPCPPGTACPPGPMPSQPIIAQQQSKAPIPDWITAASVRVSLTVNGKTKGGSGVVFHVDPASGRAFVLTNKHVAPQNGTYIVEFPQLQKFVYTSNWLGADSMADLACLEIIGDARTPYIPLGSRPLRDGEQCWSVGYPLGKGPAKFAGTYRGKNGVPNGNGAQSFTVSWASQGGQSGSGIYSAHEGRLVGLLWGGPASPAAATYCVDYSDLKRFTDYCLFQRPGQQPQQPAPIPPPPPSAPAPSVDPTWKANVDGRLTALEAKIGLPPATDPQIPAIAAAAQDAQAKTTGLAARIEGLQGLVGRVDAFKDKLDQSGAKLAIVEGLLPAVVSKVEAMSPTIKEVNDKAREVLAKSENYSGKLDRIESVLSWVQPLVPAGIGGTIIAAVLSIIAFLRRGADTARTALGVPAPAGDVVVQAQGLTAAVQGLKERVDNNDVLKGLIEGLGSRIMSRLDDIKK